MMDTANQFIKGWRGWWQKTEWGWFHLSRFVNATNSWQLTTELHPDKSCYKLQITTEKQNTGVPFLKID